MTETSAPEPSAYGMRDARGYFDFTDARGALRHYADIFAPGYDGDCSADPLYTLSAAREILAGDLEREADELDRLAVTQEVGFVRMMTQAEELRRAAAFVRQGGEP